MDILILMLCYNVRKRNIFVVRYSMSEKIKESLERFKETKEILEKFSSKEEAV